LRRVAITARELHIAQIERSKDQFETALNDGQFVTLYPSFERALRIGAPEDGQRSLSDKE
jgi:hypothetical protein